MEAVKMREPETADMAGGTRPGNAPPDKRGCAHAAPTFRRAWLYVRFVELAQQEARKVIARGDY